MARERSGHTYVTSVGEVFRDRNYSGEFSLHYHFEENDGARFLRRGAEASTIIHLKRETSLSDLSAILEKVELPPIVKERLEEMIESGEVQNYCNISNKIIKSP